GNGLFVLTPGGLAGRLTMKVTFQIPGGGVDFKGTFTLAINTTTQAVVEQFQLGGQSVNLNVPAGPYLRVEGEDIELTLAGQKISGDFVFERAIVAVTGGGTQTVVRILARNVSAAFGNGTTNY